MKTLLHLGFSSAIFFSLAVPSEAQTIATPTQQPPARTSPAAQKSNPQASSKCPQRQTASGQKAAPGSSGCANSDPGSAGINNLMQGSGD
jgi:hypothetical protein